MQYKHTGFSLTGKIVNTHHLYTILQESIYNVIYEIYKGQPYRQKQYLPGRLKVQKNSSNTSKPKFLVGTPKNTYNITVVLLSIFSMYIILFHELYYFFFNKSFWNFCIIAVLWQKYGSLTRLAGEVNLLTGFIRRYTYCINIMTYKKTVNIYPVIITTDFYK